MKNWRVIGVALVVLLCAAFAGGYFYGDDKARKELEPKILACEGIKVVRTPGGLVEVATWVKQESLAWNIAWECPFNLCKFLPTAHSQISAEVRYIYRIPLAEHWVLEKISDTPLRYRLKVPKLEPQLPVTVNLSTIRLFHNGAMFAPAGLAQQQMQGYMQPELNKRATSASYVKVVQKDAEKTVKEFAKKWMRERDVKIDDSAEIEVVF